MSAPCAFEVGDAFALPVGGRLCLVRVVATLDGSVVLANETDLRQRVVTLPTHQLEAHGERARA